MQLLRHIVNIYDLHFSDLLLVFFSFVKSGESIYDPPGLKFYDICNTSVELNQKENYFDVPKFP